MPTFTLLAWDGENWRPILKELSAEDATRTLAGLRDLRNYSLEEDLLPWPKSGMRTVTGTAPAERIAA